MCNSFTENGEMARKAECNDDADDSSKKLCLYLFSLTDVIFIIGVYVCVYSIKTTET